MSIALVKISCIKDRLIPLGLACLQAYLKQHEIPVQVFNFRADTYELPKVITDPLYQLTPSKFIINHQDFPILVPLAEAILKHGRVDFEEDFEDGLLSDILKDYSLRLFEVLDITKQRFKRIFIHINSVLPKISQNYPIVAFSLDYLNIIETVITSSFFKYIDSNIKIIWGGPSITQSYEAFKLFLEKGVCDGLVIGEGENQLLKIAQGNILNKIQGIMSMNNGKIRYKPSVQLNLDELPTPDYTDLPFDTYYDIASVYRSRGCTYRCKFCGEWKLFGPRFRVRSVENVINDIETIIDAYHPKYMIFGESLINDDLSYFEQLCDEMIHKNFNINFGTHFRAEITPELAFKAYDAGFNDAWVGFEAFSEDDLKAMNKGISVNQNVEAINNFTNAGINVLAMLVVGFSNMTEEEKNCKLVLNTIDYYSQQKVNGKPLPIQFRPAPMYLVPGSFDYAEKITTHTWPWKCISVSSGNREKIRQLEQELSTIPYEFKRPIPDRMIGELMRRIQEADRNARFAINGITKHVINMMVEMRKQKRKHKLDKMGMISQRFQNQVEIE